MKRRCSLHERRQERLSRPIEGERASNQGELDKAVPTQTVNHGDSYETSSATTVAKKATLLVTVGQRKGGQLKEMWWLR
ncbi:hypothetical protein AMTR_s00051p00169160 [Amborella trichopoda]|uniref:Uncharacterized protein n=1 Tax=Amborella trichopoda TaxID=13333 RepID=U5CTR1_AMBTC|nr:hypothetical protein AMTR_s00051p00169160 [Amborella trichopoda]